MPKTVQIRSVPDDLHRKLKVRAAELSMTLSSYLLNIAERAVEQPTLQETLKRPSESPPVYLDEDPLDEDPAEMIRRHRDA